MPEGIENLEQAFEEAAAESTEVPVDAVVTDEPSVDTDPAESPVEQADAELTDQPEVAETADTDNELQSIVDGMAGDAPEDTAEGSEDKAEPEVTLDTELTVDLGDGAETVTIRDLVDRGLRQADYTRKTQELAAQKSDNQDAMDFHAAFLDNPVEFARALAVRADLISEGDEPVKGIDAASIQSAEDVEAEVQRRVEERITTDPRMLEATAVSARAAIHAEFDRIATDRGVTISQELRQQIVDDAARAGTGDLELVFDALVARFQAVRSRTDDKRLAAPSRPTTPPATPPADAETEEMPESVDAAFAAALAEVG